jgi:hypothetical protein
MAKAADPAAVLAAAVAELVATHGPADQRPNPE